jgi:hypothetical protein
MITGFNTNVRYHGRTFHVQTEDSGRANPHVISHLYLGGTILASEKREYVDLLGSENLTVLVRRLMEKQHKAMLDRLKRGGFDEAIAARLEGPAPTDAEVAPHAAAARAPAPAAAPARAPAPAAAPARAPAPAAAPVRAPAPAAAAPARAPAPAPDRAPAPAFAAPAPPAAAAPAPQVPAAAPVPPPAASAAPAREFGAGVVSEKPLDEVILEYLIKKARSRKAEGAAAGPAPRSQE